MVYINRWDGRYRETVDEFTSYKEAKLMLTEYGIADPSAEYYLSQRCCAAWKDEG